MIVGLFITVEAIHMKKIEHKLFLEKISVFSNNGCKKNEIFKKYTDYKIRTVFFSGLYFVSTSANT